MKSRFAGYSCTFAFICARDFEGIGEHFRTVDRGFTDFNVTWGTRINRIGFTIYDLGFFKYRVLSFIACADDTGSVQAGCICMNIGANLTILAAVIIFLHTYGFFTVFAGKRTFVGSAARRNAFQLFRITGFVVSTCVIAFAAMLERI